MADSGASPGSLVDIGGGGRRAGFSWHFLLGGLIWGELDRVGCGGHDGLGGRLRRAPDVAGPFRLFAHRSAFFVGLWLHIDRRVGGRRGRVGSDRAGDDGESGGDHLGGVMNSTFPTISFPAIGTTVTVVTTREAALGAAVDVVRAEVAALDAAASRFRPDSELSRANDGAGRAVSVSGLLIGAVEDALRAAQETDGLVTPTVGGALIVAGYDRDFRKVAPDGAAITVKLRSVPGWQRVRVDRARGTLTVPPGVLVDLGATAKAGCADRAAYRASTVVGGGVLVNLGGDIAVAGPAPDGGWPVRVADRHDASPDAPGMTVAIRDGGMATSGTGARRWCRGGQVLHHIVDPRTGVPAGRGWRTVTVVGRTCLEANTASTAAVILGPEAPAWLTDRRLHARLVADDGATFLVGDWPVESGADPFSGSAA